MRYNAVSPRERIFIDNIVGGEKYDIAYTCTKDNIAHYVSSVDGELVIYKYDIATQHLSVVGHYYSVWVRGREDSELEFVREMLNIAPFEMWEEITLDINRL